MKKRTIKIHKSAVNRDAMTQALAIAQHDEYSFGVIDENFMSVTLTCDDDQLFSLGVFFSDRRTELDKKKAAEQTVKG